MEIARKLHDGSATEDMLPAVIKLAVVHWTGKERKEVCFPAVNDGVLAAAEMEASIVDERDSWGCYLRHEGSFAQIGIVGPTVLDEPTAVLVKDPPKHEWGLLRTSHS